MSNTLRFIGKTGATSYRCSSFPLFLDWLKKETEVAFDTETNYTDSILQRQLKVLSFCNQSETETWVIQWEFLTIFQQKELMLELRKKLCIIHSVSFDYAVMKKHGVVLEKVWDTLLAEQILTNGYSSESSALGLQAIYLKRFSLDISKDAQLTFGEVDEYDDEQIEYAAIDVIRLCSLKRIQKGEMKYFDDQVKEVVNRHKTKGLRKTAWWENEFVKCVADMEMTGVRIDKDKWYAISDSVTPIYQKELKELNKLVVSDFKEVLIEKEWLSEKDRFVGNVWSSSAKKKALLSEIFPFEIEKTSMVELKKLLQEHDPAFPEGLKLSGKAWKESDYPTTFNSLFAVIKLLILRTSQDVEESLNSFLLANYRDYCIEQGWLIPANKLTLNWGSPTQRLAIFQAIDPSIPSTGKDVIVDFEHKSPIISHYLGWGEVDYQLKNFGKGFYDNHVELDGKHRTRFNQILQTGRLSSVKPNMLNIPRKHDAYRAAIIPDPGFDMIDADYGSQELVVVANLANETSWLEYLDKGYDLHSRNSELIFGQEWIDATEEGCEYYAEHPNVAAGVEGFTHKYKKCKCKGHIEMRDNSKAVSFGSIYGISKFKLAFNLKISEERAEFILTRFFEIAPNIKKMMDRFGAFALEHGYIIEPVLGRMRFFDRWKLAVPKERGSVQRAAFNTPIQSSGSSMLKIAFVLLRRWINHNNLQDKVQLLLPYHDECIAQAVNTEDGKYVELTKRKVEHYMKLAASLAGFVVDADAQSGSSWLEAH